MTAYSVPATFSHGDYPNADDLNTLSNSQKHIYEILPASAQHPVAYYTTLDDYPSGDAGEQYNGAGRWIVLTHTYRYLHYATDGSGLIMPYSTSLSVTDTGDNWFNPSWQSENTVSLAATNGNNDAISITAYDLDSISWLNYGDQYVVYDVFGCYEYDEAHPPIEATPPFTMDYLSASALNSMSRNIELIKGRMDAPVRPRYIDSNDRWLFNKVATHLVIKGTILDDSVNSVDIKVATNPGSMGTAIATLNNSGSGYAANDSFDSGNISLSSYTNGEDYLVEIIEDGSGTLRVEQIYLTNA